MPARTTTILCAALTATLLLAPACANRSVPKEQRTPEQSATEATRLFSLGRVAEKRREWADAEVYYRQSVQAYGDLGCAWNNLGVVLMQQQNYVEAINAFRRAADVLPTDPTPYENIGQTYQRAGYPEDSLRAFEMSLERDPNWLPSIRGYASSTKLLNNAREGDLDVLRRGLMLETDPKWRELYDFQRLRIERDLKEESER